MSIWGPGTAGVGQIGSTVIRGAGLGREGKQGFWLSLTLHLGMVALVLLQMLFASLRPKEKPYVMELVSVPVMAEQAAENAAPRVETPKPFEVPEIDPVRRVDHEPLALPEPVKPAPPKEVVRPPEAVKPTPTPPKEAAKKPEPEAKPPPKQMSVEDFRKQYGQPKPRSTPVKAKQFNIPKIDTTRIQEALQSVVVTSSPAAVASMSQVNQDALGQYIGLLRSRIDAVWDKPDNYTGDLNEIVVLFDVAANGTLSGIRLEQGNPGDAFARSVLEAFRRVRPVGPTPTGQAYTFRMPFRIVEL